YIPNYFLKRKDPGTVQQPIWQGARKTRRDYALANLLTFLPLVFLMAYMLSNSGERHPDGPAGSALVYLFRESVPILITILALFGCFIYLFFSTLGRLRDINVNPVWGLTYFLPGLAIPLTIFLLLIPGTKGPNKYGEEPSLKKPKLDKIREIASHKTPTQIEADRVESNKVDKENTDLLRCQHDVIKEKLKAQELCKVFKNTIGNNKRGSKILFVGFDLSLSKYYMSIAKTGTPKAEIKKQYFLSYQLMSKALYEQTGLLITEVADLST
ncbi:DUF805 domain-containing protein, partial [Oleiphilus sp. HI0086]